MVIPTMTTAVGTAAFGVPGAMVFSYLGRQANVALGLEQPGMGGDVASVALPGIPAIWGGAKSLIGRWARGSRAGQAVTAADEATAAAQQQYREGVEAAEQQAEAQKQHAIGLQQQRETQYQARVEQQRTRAASTHQAQEAERAQAAATAQQQYGQAETAQRQAVTQARTIPGTYAPATAPRVLYQKVATVAPQAPVTLTRTQALAAEIQDTLTQAPGLQPSRMQRVLGDMRAGRETQTVREVHEYLKDLGVLTRSRDATTRRQARQLFGALHDDLEDAAQQIPATNEARELLLQANAAQRRTYALEDVRDVLRQSISRTERNQPQISMRKVLTDLERLHEKDPLFAGSFTPDEWKELYGRFEQLAGTPRIPATVPDAFTPTPFQPPAPPPRPREAYATFKPVPEAGPPPTPAVPADMVPPSTPIMKGVRRLVEIAGAGDLLLGGPGARQAIGLVPLAADIVQYLALRQDGQRYLRALMAADGTINVEAIITLAGGRAALEEARKKQR